MKRVHPVSVSVALRASCLRTPPAWILSVPSIVKFALAVQFALNVPMASSPSTDSAPLVSKDAPSAQPPSQVSASPALKELTSTPPPAPA